MALPGALVQVIWSPLLTPLTLNTSLELMLAERRSLLRLIMSRKTVKGPWLNWLRILTSTKASIWLPFLSHVKEFIPIPEQVNSTLVLGQRIPPVVTSTGLVKTSERCDDIWSTKQTSFHIILHHSFTTGQIKIMRVSYLPWRRVHLIVSVQPTKLQFSSCIKPVCHT